MSYSETKWIDNRLGQKGLQFWLVPISTIVFIFPLSVVTRLFFVDVEHGELREVNIWGRQGPGTQSTENHTEVCPSLPGNTPGGRGRRRRGNGHRLGLGIKKGFTAPPFSWAWGGWFWWSFLKVNSWKMYGRLLPQQLSNHLTQNSVFLRPSFSKR